MKITNMEIRGKVRHMDTRELRMLKSLVDEILEDRAVVEALDNVVPRSSKENAARRLGRALAGAEFVSARRRVTWRRRPVRKPRTSKRGGIEFFTEDVTGKY